MSGRLTERLRIAGEILTGGLRRRRTSVDPAGIMSVKVALVMAEAVAEALTEACETARREAREAGVVDAQLDSTLCVTTACAKTFGRNAERDLRRLGIRP
jgi:hypothetical protein